MNSGKCGLAALLIGGFIAGCSTTSEVVVNQPEAGRPAATAYLVSHGGNSKDMDDSFQEALSMHGLKVTTGESDPADAKTYDMIVKYDDTWRWDLAMFLLNLNVDFYDGKDGALMAHSTWHNSPAHGFQKANDVVPPLVSATFAKLDIKTGQSGSLTPAPAAATGH